MLRRCERLLRHYLQRCLYYYADRWCACLCYLCRHCFRDAFGALSCRRLRHMLIRQYFQTCAAASAPLLFRAMPSTFWWCCCLFRHFFIAFSISLLMPSFLPTSGLPLSPHFDDFMPPLIFAAWLFTLWARCRRHFYAIHFKDYYALFLFHDDAAAWLCHIFFHCWHLLMLSILRWCPLSSSFSSYWYFHAAI